MTADYSQPQPTRQTVCCGQQSQRYDWPARSGTQKVVSDSHTLDTELFTLTVWFCLVWTVTVSWLFLLGAKLFNLVLILRSSQLRDWGIFFRLDILEKICMV